jgi:hypothetical protein
LKRRNLSLVLLAFICNNSTDVKIDLLDITGRTVRTFVNSSNQPGVYEESFYLESNKPEKHMVHIPTDTESEVKSLLIIK